MVIEHNVDLIACADWVIDMGPEGGEGGGTVVAEGTPEELARVAESHTGKYLALLFERENKLGPRPSKSGQALARAGDAAARARSAEVLLDAFLIFFAADAERGLGARFEALHRDPLAAVVTDAEVTRLDLFQRLAGSCRGRPSRARANGR